MEILTLIILGLIILFGLYVYHQRSVEQALKQQQQTSKDTADKENLTIISTNPGYLYDYWYNSNYIPWWRSSYYWPFYNDWVYDEPYYGYWSSTAYSSGSRYRPKRRFGSRGRPRSTSRGRSRSMSRGRSTSRGRSMSRGRSTSRSGGRSGGRRR